MQHEASLLLIVNDYNALLAAMNEYEEPLVLSFFLRRKRNEKKKFFFLLAAMNEYEEPLVLSLLVLY